MKTKSVLRRAAAVGLTMLAVLGCAGGARAAVLHFTFSGVMDSGGIDSSDTFGLAGSGGFGGQTITGHLFLDTANAPAPTVFPTVNNYENFSGAPWLWGSYTLNGVTRNIGPDFRTFTSVSSADFGLSGDLLSLSTNADFEQIGPTERVFKRSGLDLSLFDADDIIVPGKDLPSEALAWSPDNPGDSGTGQFLIFDQLEELPNGPLTTTAFVLATFTITDVTAAVEAIDAPGSLPTFAMGLAALVLLASQRAARSSSRPNARA
jgi:hypothetical protein